MTSPTEGGGHAHWFGSAVAIGRVAFCRQAECSEMRVQTNRGWRELTVDEKISVTARMMEDLVLVDAMSLIHGGNQLGKPSWFLGATDRGVARVAMHRGYD